MDPDLQRAFLRNRRRMLATHPMLSAPQRLSALRAFDADLRVAPEAPVEAELPTPGGVGYGMFYAAAFRSAFQAGSAIYWEVITPTAAGGSVTDIVYLTATNRTALGVEALVEYKAQNGPLFAVFDWARQPADPWQRSIPFTSLGDYLKHEVVNGVDFVTLPLMNMTYTTGPDTWLNQVWFSNGRASRWDLAYQYTYPATLMQQVTGWPGSWGPILETFEDHYTSTNPMGALSTQLAARINSAWGTWSPLGQDESQLRVDNKGFTPEFLDPNSSWIVHS